MLMDELIESIPVLVKHKHMYNRNSALCQYKLPVKPSSWGITEEIFVAAWQQASASRPDRYTILNNTDLSYERLAGIYKEMEEVFG